MTEIPEHLLNRSKKLRAERPDLYEQIAPVELSNRARQILADGWAIPNSLVLDAYQRNQLLISLDPHRVQLDKDALDEAARLMAAGELNDMFTEHLKRFQDEVQSIVLAEAEAPALRIVGLAFALVFLVPVTVAVVAVGVFGVPWWAGALGFLWFGLVGWVLRYWREVRQARKIFKAMERALKDVVKDPHRAVTEGSGDDEPPIGY